MNTNSATSSWTTNPQLSNLAVVRTLPLSVGTIEQNQAIPKKIKLENKPQ